MRAMNIALAGLVLAATLAGCTQQVPTTTPTVQDVVYVSPAIPAVDAVKLLADHEAFVTVHNERAANKPTHESARVALATHFEEAGLTTVRFNFTNGITQANIMGIKWGQDRENWVFVGGHYDTTTDDCLVSKTPQAPSPAPSVPQVENPCVGRSISQGAYDDGSGTMMAVHLAKVFASIDTYYTIAFVAFDGEERGIQGAQAMVNAVLEGNFTVDGIQPTIVGALDLDMIGINWPGTNAPINLLTNSDNAAKLVLAKAKEMGFPDDQIIRKDSLKLGSSDYAAFWRVKDPSPIPTVFFISAFEEVGSPGQAPSIAQSPVGVYPFWHLQDNVETMTAMAGGRDNLRMGFQSATELAGYVVYFMSCQPEIVLDAVPHA